MCGIFGIVVQQDAKISRHEVTDTLSSLFKLSESRGKESAGIHAYLPANSESWTLKGDIPGTKLITTKEYKKLTHEALQKIYSEDPDTPSSPLALISHSRLVTNGVAHKIENNQPVFYDGITMIHNGIVVNVQELWEKNSHLTRKAEVDTEVLAALVSDHLSHTPVPEAATKDLYTHIKGAASIAWIHEASDFLVLATNTGDIYFHHDSEKGYLIFASERYILRNAISALESSNESETHNIVQIEPQNAALIDLTAFEINPFALDGSPLNSHEKRISIETANPSHHDLSVYTPSEIDVHTKTVDESLIKYNEDKMRSMKRCSCCVLPETFPYISFDDDGVCNYCRGYVPKYKDVDPEEAETKFLKLIEKYRSKNGDFDVLVPFSGGRDSCYGLHLIKTKFDFNPITFTYDWGMVTDLARRNTARMCGSLGVQNILVSADIKTKRENIRKNVSAWLKRPDLGMVPLFMAGDKHFFKVVNDLKRQTDIRLDLWSANPLENTDFKSGFCNVEPDFDKSRLDYLSMSRKLKMALYYASNFARNPRYINTSLLDTATAFLSYYIEPRKDFFFMFNHLIWQEDTVNNILLNKYDFETSPDSKSTWRIGDGTAPFYNYIYMTSNGFTEFDTFRSNQIREGHITREEALEEILVENRPRIPSLKWYLDTIGLDFNTTIRQINKLDKLGLHNN